MWSKRDSLPADQQKLLDDVKEKRTAFLQLPDQIFPLLEGDRWREDLYLFRTEAVPLTNKMESLLAEMTADQQTLLTTELDQGRQSLSIANREGAGRWARRRAARPGAGVRHPRLHRRPHSPPDGLWPNKSRAAILRLRLRSSRAMRSAFWRARSTA